MFEIVRDARPDALVVAGDVYDRAVPPPDAVALLDDFLTRVAGAGVPVVAVAGNHDSPERMSFGARLLEARRVYLRGSLARAAEPVEIPGKGLVYAVPWVDPEVVRGQQGDEAVQGHAAATELVLRRVREDAAGRALPTVLVAHAFVQGAEPTPDSERPCSVGGTSAIAASALAGFGYVALGHLHAPQEVSPGARYSGSLLKYSFSEAPHVKGVVLVEVRDDGVTAESIPLGARRDVVRLRGTLQVLLHQPELSRHEHDLVEATLEDEGYVLDAKHRLQARFPHVLSVVRGALAPGGEGRFASRVQAAQGDDLELFDAFFETVAGATPGPGHREAFAEALASLHRRERAA